MPLIRRIEYTVACDYPGCKNYLALRKSSVGLIAKDMYQLWRDAEWRNKGKLWYCPPHAYEAKEIGGSDG